MSEVTKTATNICLIANRYHLTVEQIAEIIKIHNGNINTAIRTIESLEKIAKN